MADRSLRVLRRVGMTYPGMVRTDGAVGVLTGGGAQRDDRLVVAADLPVSGGEVVAGTRGVGVVGTRHPVAVVAGVVMLGPGRRLVRGEDTLPGDVRPVTAAGWRMIAGRAGTSLLTAGGLLVIAHRFGPAEGAVGALPIFTPTSCGFLFSTAGSARVWCALAGMVQGLPVYSAFALADGFVALHLGAPAAGVAGSLVRALHYLVHRGKGSAAR